MPKQPQDYVGETGLCPVCGSPCTIIGVAKDNRLIGACQDRFSGLTTDAFTVQQWEADEDATEEREWDNFVLAQLFRE